MTVSRNINNFSKPDLNFESWQKENNVYSSSQCNSVTIVNEQTRPFTALEGQAKIVASKKQCVALYLTNANLPSVKAIAESVSKNSAYYAIAKNMQNDFNKYAPGKEYFRSSRFPIDSATLYSLGSGKGKIPEVAARLVIEAFQACETEAQTRFNESVRDWNEVTNPTTVANRIEPLRKLCRTRFSRDEERLDQLSQFRKVKLDVEQEIQRLNSSSLESLPDKKLLIPHACPAENL